MTFGLAEHPARFWIFVTIALVGLVLTAVIVLVQRRMPRRFGVWAKTLTAVYIIAVGWYLIGLGMANSNYTPDYVIKTALSPPVFDLPEPEDFARIDLSNGMDNQAMFWGLPTIQAFHSVVPESIGEFWRSIGENRGVASRPLPKLYYARSLLSVRWLFEYANPNNREYIDAEKLFEANHTTAMPYWQKFGEQNDFRIYENQTWIPMGFTYDAFLSRSAYNTMDETRRGQALLKALVIENADLPAVQKLLPPLNVRKQDFTQHGFKEDCLERRQHTVDDFRIDKTGFSAKMTQPADNFVFFSVPHDKGWSATVGGQPARIFRVNVGFMAVSVPAGVDVAIDFRYDPPGVKTGLLISGGCGAALGVYLGAFWWGRKLQIANGKLQIIVENDI